MIYNADYRNIAIPDDAVVISDPPYGIGFQYGQHQDKGGEAYMDILRPLCGRKLVLLQYPEEMMRYLVPLFGPPDDVYTWCYNSNTSRQHRMWGFWGVKPYWEAVRQPCRNPMDPRVNQDVRSYDWCSDIQQVKNVSEEKTDHPCQIPVVMMKRIIRLTMAQHVCDPFMGSGSTGVACAEMGVNFTGMEVDAQYFAIAQERIAEANSQITMGW